MEARAYIGWETPVARGEAPHPRPGTSLLIQKKLHWGHVARCLGDRTPAAPGPGDRGPFFNFFKMDIYFWIFLNINKKKTRTSAADHEMLLFGNFSGLAYLTSREFIINLDQFATAGAHHCTALALFFSEPQWLAFFDALACHRYERLVNHYAPPEWNVKITP